MEEGVIVSWQVKVGDVLKVGDILAEVETDKATMDLENFEKGELLHLEAKEGAAIAVDSVIAIVGKKGEDFAAILAEAKATSTLDTPKAEATQPVVEDAKPTNSVSAEKTHTPESNAIENSSDRTKASPLAKVLAKEKGVNISTVVGSGEGGRIIKRDIENFQSTGANHMQTAVLGEEAFTDQPLSQMRKTIAKRLSESKFTAPHFYLTMEIEMDEALRARAEMNTYSEIKLSVNDLIVKASAAALTRNPKVNASWLGDKIRTYQHIHIGVAMAVDEGLLVPVVKHANHKSLSQISAEVKAFSGKAKDKKLQPTDWEGNTFTISNLGMFGIEEFTAIVNPPDACILAIGGVKETVLVKDGVMKPGHVMKVTLSCDHRIVDGVVGSKFLQTFKELMENPVKLLV